MKILSFTILIFAATQVLAQDRLSFGSLSASPNPALVLMQDMNPCLLPDGSPASDFKVYMPSTEIAHLQITNTLSSPIEIQYAELDTADGNVVMTSSDRETQAMFPGLIIQPHQSITAACGLRIGNVELQDDSKPETKAMRLHVYGIAKDEHGISTVFEVNTSVTLKWNGLK